MNLNNLAKMTILNEADDLFDIDKEVDAQLKRVQNRMERKRQEEENPQTSEDAQDRELQQTNQQEEEPQQIEEPAAEEPVEDDTSAQPEDDQQQSGEYEYMDGSGRDIPDNYEPKQTIPELRILSTLSDTEYQLCNIKVIEQFRELRDNANSTVNNIIMNINSRNARQKQVLDFVQDNLRDMIEDIDNYILYRNNDVYEENVTAFLTYLKRYQIATNLIKVIVDENSDKERSSKK